MTQDSVELVVVLLDRHADRFEALADRLGPLPERQRVDGEELGVVVPGLEQHDVALEAPVSQVALKGELEPGVQQGTEDLVDHAP